MMFGEGTYIWETGEIYKGTFNGGLNGIGKIQMDG